MAQDSSNRLMDEQQRKEYLERLLRAFAMGEISVESLVIFDKACQQLGVSVTEIAEIIGQLEKHEGLEVPEVLKICYQKWDVLQKEMKPKDLKHELNQQLKELSIGPSTEGFARAWAITNRLTREIERVLKINDPMDFEFEISELLGAPFREKTGIYGKRPRSFQHDWKELINKLIYLTEELGEQLNKKAQSLGFSQGTVAKYISCFRNYIKRERLEAKELKPEVQMDLLRQLLRVAAQDPSLIEGDLAKRYQPLALSLAEVDKCIKQVEESGVKLDPVLKLHYQVIAPLSHGLALLSRRENWTTAYSKRTLEAAQLFNQKLDWFVTKARDEAQLKHLVDGMVQMIANQFKMRLESMPNEGQKDITLGERRTREKLHNELLYTQMRLATLAEVGLISKPPDHLLNVLYQPILKDFRNENEPLVVSGQKKSLFFLKLQQAGYSRSILEQLKKAFDTVYPKKRIKRSVRPGSPSPNDRSKIIRQREEERLIG